MKIIFLSLSIILSSLLFATDSVLIYYVPITSSFIHFIHKDNIDLHADPYKIVDPTKISNLENLLKDSLEAKHVGKITKKSIVDARIVIKFFSGNNLEKQITIVSNNRFAAINKKKYYFQKLMPLYNFIISNCKPETRRQKIFYQFPPEKV